MLGAIAFAGATLTLSCGGRTIDERDGGGNDRIPAVTGIMVTSNPPLPDSPKPDTPRPVSPPEPDVPRPDDPRPVAPLPEPPPAPEPTIIVPDRPDPTPPATTPPKPDQSTAPSIIPTPTDAPAPQMGTCGEPLLLDFDGEREGSHSGWLSDAFDDFQDWCGRGPEVMFTWTAPETGRYAFDTLGTQFDATLAVVEDVPNGCGRLLRCDDDGATANQALQAYLQLYAEAGTTYRIAVEGYDAQAHGSFILNASYLSSEEIDCQALVLPSELNVSVQGDFETDALVTALPSHCNSGSRVVTFQFVAPVDGLYTFDTHGSNFDTVLVIGQDCASTPWRCNDDSLDGQTSSVQQRLSFGQMAVIHLSAYGSTPDTGVVRDAGAPDPAGDSATADSVVGDSNAPSEVAPTARTYTLNVSTTLGE